MFVIGERHCVNSAWISLQTLVRSLEECLLPQVSHVLSDSRRNLKAVPFVPLTDPFGRGHVMGFG
jgi:hypothetical protein